MSAPTWLRRLGRRIGLQDVHRRVHVALLDDRGLLQTDKIQGNPDQAVLVSLVRRLDRRLDLAFDRRLAIAAAEAAV